MNSTPEPVVVSWSGGKDSALMLAALRASDEYRPVALFTSINEDHERVSIHGVRHELLVAQATSIGLPLFEMRTPSGASMEEYEKSFTDGIANISSALPAVRTIAFGDLFLLDVRSYREQQIKSIGLKPVFPLWGIPTDTLAARFIADGFRAKLACVDTTQLDGSFAGMSFGRAFLTALPNGVDPCGERGEFHTFVTAGPIFRSPIPHRKGDTVEREGRFVFQEFEAFDAGSEGETERPCTECGLAFRCGASASSCWCMDLPQVLPVPAEGTGGCLCRDCLEAAVDLKLTSR